MSLINKMLQELDRRDAIGAADGVPQQQIRAVAHPGGGHEWFWRMLALLAMTAVGWVGWVAYQIQPRNLATEMALNAGEAAMRKAASKPAPAQAPAQVAQAAPPEAKPAPGAQPDTSPVPTASPAPAPQATPAPAVAAAPNSAERFPTPPELFRLALSIDRPLKARAPAGPRAKQAVAAAPAKTPESIRVTRRDSSGSALDEAETLFRRGVERLNEGRISEAQAEFSAALGKAPTHEPSRQALIAVLLERRDLDQARRLLAEGLTLNPAQAQFATVLARVLVEQKDYSGAMGVLDAANSAGINDGDFQLLRGAVLQRLGRHADALAAFEQAVKIADQPGATWVAMGISYEATGRKAEALQAYRRSLGLSSIAQDVRAYAEGRIRALN